MCLYTKQICPLRARKDIVCYKKFLVYEFLLQTYYQFHAIVKPEKNYPTLMDDTGVTLGFYRSNHGIRGSRCQIFGGMIHAYKTKPKLVSEHTSSYSTIGWYKCIIPKGTLYYVGIDNDICAKKMLVVEEVNPNTAGSSAV